MSDRMTLKKALLAVVLTALGLVTIIGFSRALVGRSSAQDAAKADDAVATRNALRRGGLRGAAKLKGHYVGEIDPHWDFGQFTVEDLTKNSEAVVVGTPTKKLGARLGSEGQLIFTDYEVAVQEVIKGEIKPRSSITVALVGGRVEFEDGTSAELMTDDFEHMRVGATYTIFLSGAGSDPETYTLTGGPQALIEVSAGTKVKSHGRESNLSVKEIKDKDKDAFLKDVRKHAMQWPHPGKCCG